MYRVLYEFLAAACNKALNDNWKEFIDDLQPVLTEITVHIGINLIKNIISDNPYDDIFPE